MSYFLYTAFPNLDEKPHESKKNVKEFIRKPTVPRESECNDSWLHNCAIEFVKLALYFCCKQLRYSVVSWSSVSHAKGNKKGSTEATFHPCVAATFKVRHHSAFTIAFGVACFG